MVCDMKEIQIRKNDAGQRLDRFVGKAVPLLPASLAQKYIRLKRVKLNGKPYAKPYIGFDDIAAGGTLEFEMGPDPAVWYEL